MKTIDDLLKYYQSKLDYYSEELRRHLELDISIFGFEQTKIYEKNIQRFRENIEILDLTLDSLSNYRRFADANSKKSNA